METITITVITIIILLRKDERHTEIMKVNSREAKRPLQNTQGIESPAPGQSPGAPASFMQDTN